LKKAREIGLEPRRDLHVAAVARALAVAPSRSIPFAARGFYLLSQSQQTRYRHTGEASPFPITCSLMGGVPVRLLRGTKRVDQSDPLEQSNRTGEMIRS